jgi:hypothetical protein
MVNVAAASGTRHSGAVHIGNSNENHSSRGPEIVKFRLWVVVIGRRSIGWKPFESTSIMRDGVASLISSEP